MAKGTIHLTNECYVFVLYVVMLFALFFNFHTNAQMQWTPDDLSTHSNTRHVFKLIRCIPRCTSTHTHTTGTQKHLSDLLYLQQTPDDDNGDNGNNDDENNDDIYWLITVIARSSYFLLSFLYWAPEHLYKHTYLFY